MSWSVAQKGRSAPNPLVNRLDGYADRRGGGVAQRRKKPSSG